MLHTLFACFEHLNCLVLVGVFIGNSKMGKVQLLYLLYFSVNNSSNNLSVIILFENKLSFLPNNQNTGPLICFFFSFLFTFTLDVLQSWTCVYILLCCFPGSGKSEGSPVALQETSKPSQEENRDLNKPGRPAVSCIALALIYYLAILHFLSQYAHYYLNFLLRLIFNLAFAWRCF